MRKLNGFATIVVAASVVCLPACGTLTSPVRAIDNAVISAKASARSYGEGMYALQFLLFPLNFTLSAPAELGVGLWRDLVGWFTPGKNTGDVWFEGIYRNWLELEQHKTVTDGQASGHANRGQIRYWDNQDREEDSDESDENDEENEEDSDE